MSSIAIEKSCCIALNVIGNIAYSTCYNSFFYLFTIFINNICNLIRFVQLLMLIFVQQNKINRNYGYL
jgi:hypothetical protein